MTLPVWMDKELSQAICKAMPAQLAWSTKMNIVDTAAKVLNKHFNKYLAEIAELDQVIDRQASEIVALKAAAHAAETQTAELLAQNIRPASLTSADELTDTGQSCRAVDTAPRTILVRDAGKAPPAINAADLPF